MLILKYSEVVLFKEKHYLGFLGGSKIEYHTCFSLSQWIVDITFVSVWGWEAVVKNSEESFSCREELGEAGWSGGEGELQDGLSKLFNFMFQLSCLK